MFSRLRFYLRPPAFEDPQRRYAARLLHYTLLICILGGALVALIAPYLYLPNPAFTTQLALVTLGVMSVSFVLLHSGHDRLSAFLMVGIVLAAFSVAGFLHGISTPNPAGILLAVILGGVLLDSRGALGIGALSLLVLWGMVLTAKESPPAVAMAGIYTPIFIMSALVVVFYRRELDAALKELRAKQSVLLARNTELDALKQGMEITIQERTRQLETQTRLMENILNISRRLAQSLTTEDLLKTAARMIHQEFNLYHTGIYLPDSGGEYVVLQAVGDERGQKLLDEKHRLRIDGQSIIGAAASSLRPRVTMDARADPLYIAHPALPDTRSEAALPLLRGDRLLGVLDIESDRPHAFDKESVAILQHLADQIAVSIENVRLQSESRQALRRAERAYAEISARSWQEYIRRAPWAGFRSATGEVTPLDKDAERDISPEVRDTIRSGQVYTEGDTAVIPIQVRRQTIASLRLRKAPRSPWGDEELRLMQAAGDQIGQALENARLYEESQKRAAREELLSASTARMRATLDLESVLQTAVRELRSALRLSEAEIRLSTPPAPAQADSPATTESNR